MCVVGHLADKVGFLPHAVVCNRRDIGGKLQRGEFIVGLTHSGLNGVGVEPSAAARSGTFRRTAQDTGAFTELNAGFYAQSEALGVQVHIGNSQPVSHFIEKGVAGFLNCVICGDHAVVADTAQNQAGVRKTGILAVALQAGRRSNRIFLQRRQSDIWLYDGAGGEHAVEGAVDQRPVLVVDQGRVIVGIVQIFRQIVGRVGGCRQHGEILYPQHHGGARNAVLAVAARHPLVALGGKLAPVGLGRLYVLGKRYVQDILKFAVNGQIDRIAGNRRGLDGFGRKRAGAGGFHHLFPGLAAQFAFKGLFNAAFAQPVVKRIALVLQGVVFLL